MPARYAHDLQSTYDEVSQGYAQSHGDDLDTELLDQFLHLSPKGSMLLDLGAGLGRDSAYFVEKGWNVTIFDISSELLKYAKERVPQAIIVQGDMTDLHFEDNTFGGIWASMSLLHLTKKEMKSVVTHLHSLVTSNGIFMCKMRSGEGEHIVESSKYGKPMKRFFSYYLEDELVKLMSDCGFTVLEHFQLQQDTPEKTIVVIARK